MQVVQKKGSCSGAWVLIQSPVHQMQHSPADSPRPGSPGPEVRPFAGRADGFSGPPSLCPAPPAAPSPSAPRFRLLGAQLGGERERPSPLTLPALGGGTAPLTFPHPPPRGLASLLLFRPPSPRAQSPLFSSSGCRHAWTPCRAADLPASRLGSVPTPHDTALRPSSRDRGDEAAQTRPFSPPLIRSTARGLQRRACGSRGLPYPDSSPSPWGTRSCRTGRSWDSWLREGLGRGRPSSRAFSFPGASWREAAAAATTQAAATAAGARELASASALLPLINTAGRRGCIGAGTRRGRGQGRARAARFPGDVGLRGGGFRGGRGGWGARLGAFRGYRVPGRSPAEGAHEKRARTPGTPCAGGGADPVWLHIWGSRVAGSGQAPRTRRGWGWNPPERRIGFTRFGDFPLCRSIPGVNLLTEREAPAPPLS